jgi:FlaA1/EpsC-like NDP-sugar epimerase
MRPWTGLAAQCAARLVLPALRASLAAAERGVRVPTRADDAAALLGRPPIAVSAMRLALGYAGRSVLVSGAGGSIGSELCRQILACDPRRLVLFDLSEPALFAIDRDLRTMPEARGVEIVPILGSVADAPLVSRVLVRERVDVVLHAAAYKHVPLVEGNPLAGFANNVLGTETLARESRAAGVGRFVLISTDKAVNPTNVMGATKRLAEQVVAREAAAGGPTRFAAVRFGNVLGSSGSVVPLFQAQIAAGGPVTVTDPAATRYFMSVTDAVRLVLVAGAHAQGGETFVLDMGTPVAIGDLARRMIRASGNRVRAPGSGERGIEIVTTGLRPGERLHEEDVRQGAVPGDLHPAILTTRPVSQQPRQLDAVLEAGRHALAGGDAEAIRQLLARAMGDDRAAANPPQDATDPPPRTRHTRTGAKDDGGRMLLAG